jgi:hypothetical protein
MKTTMRCELLPTRMEELKRTIIRSGEDIEQLEPSNMDV